MRCVVKTRNCARTISPCPLTTPCMCRDRKSTRLNSSHTEIYTLSLHDALPIYKIGLLAEMTHALRRENAQLRKDNIALSADNAMYVQRMREEQERVEALLEKIPELVQAGLEQAASEAENYSAENGKEA